MAMTEADIVNLFTYHVPTAEQQVKYQEIRQQALKFALTIYRVVPDSAEKTLAIRKLHDTVMMANAAIAVNNG